ncbi:MAG: TetR/AcrR family transcriptional regulator [Candidatus Kerfeldbacteria bacterium]|nr:TetR/AcrR family transcriptional regulator [Candidatus Kerfeldbacteria bacterium]
MKDTKQDIIAKQFQKHFEHFGYKKTSVDDVAKALNMSKKTIYQYFNSKEKVFYYIVSGVAQMLSKKMEKQLEKFSTNKEKLNQFITIIFKETKRWIKKGNDAFEFKYKYDIAELAFQEAYDQLLRKIIEDGMKQKEFEKQSLDVIISHIHGIISESMKLLHTNPSLNIEKDVERSIMKLIL